jgi:hypothetical protein
MMNFRHRFPATMAALLMLALSATGVAARPNQLGTPTTTDAGLAVCDLKVALRGGPQVDTSVTAGLGQEVEFYGYGYAPDTDVDIGFSHSSIPASTFTVTTNAVGDFAFAVYFGPGAEGDWNVMAPALPSDPGCDSGDAVWVTVQTGHSFTDIADHLFEAEITWLFQRGITTGCAATAFCPDSAVTRQQMASFLVRALGLDATDADFFTDDEGSIHEADINSLAASGITAGCGATTFCPTQPVSREQMASFLVRGLGLDATGTDFFTDDEASIHEADINSLAASGITAGCTPTQFCPTATVTRGQMAAFLERALF